MKYVIYNALTDVIKATADEYAIAETIANALAWYDDMPYDFCLDEDLINSASDEPYEVQPDEDFDFTDPKPVWDC